MSEPAAGRHKEPRSNQEEPETGGVKPKGRYHHGGLREALIASSYQLVAEGGAENFLLSDACRLAGVSTAAPYKHFKDRDEILGEVCMRAFDTMTERSIAAVKANGEGTLAGIVALGESYVQFAVDEQRLFRLMFGQHPTIKQDSDVQNDGERCFSHVIEQVALYCEVNGLPGDPRSLAIRLWTFVHGAASLLIDEDYAVVAPDLDVMQMIRDTTPLILAGAGTTQNSTS